MSCANIKEFFFQTRNTTGTHNLMQTSSIIRFYKFYVMIMVNFRIFAQWFVSLLSCFPKTWVFSVMAYATELIIGLIGVSTSEPSYQEKDVFIICKVKSYCFPLKMRCVHQISLYESHTLWTFLLGRFSEFFKWKGEHKKLEKILLMTEFFFAPVDTRGSVSFHKKINLN